MDSAETSTNVTYIKASNGWRALDVTEIWKYRELLYFLMLRDVKLRYRQTFLGVAWAVMQPLLTMAVFTVFFGKLAGLPSDGKPYALFTLAALVPWQLFSYSLTQSSNSLVAEQRLITKVYFPRLIVPLASVLAGVADFAIALLLLFGLMAWFGISLTWSILALPLLSLFALAAAVAVGLWLSALNVQYRDVRYTIPFLTQLWMFATPVAYPSDLVPAEYRAWYGLNPMTGVIEGFRWALLDTPPPSLSMMFASLFITCVLLVGGALYFRRMERTFADVI
ncbi:MAG: ABC transporter permease [Pirellulales bacterium]